MAVYFIQATDGTVKIGRALDVNRRLGALQTAHAYELNLLRVIDGGAVEEWECHHEFRDYRIRGEWFKFKEEMLTFQPRGKSKLALLSEYKSRRSADPSYEDSLVAFVRDVVRRMELKQGEVAALMGMSPSSLSRKLSQRPNDSLRFTLDDLERFMEVTGDKSPVLYLVEKYLTDVDEEAALEKRLAEIRARKNLKQVS